MVSKAQMQQAPRPEWTSAYTHEDERSESGVYYDWNFSGQWVPTPSAQQNLGEAQGRGDTGEEWWFGHSNFSEGQQVTGVVTAGYGSWPNCYWKGAGCTWDITDEINSPGNYAPNPKQFERPNFRKGETRGMVARFDLDGNVIWYRKLLPGLIYNAVQDLDGNIVVAGQTYSNVWPDDMESTDNGVIRWNSSATLDLATLDCAAFGQSNVPRLGYVAKLTAEGEVMWCTVLTAETGAQGFTFGSLMHDIAPIPGTNGTEYVVVGQGNRPGTTTAPTIFRLGPDGLLLNRVCLQVGEFGVPSNWPTVDFGWLTSITYDTPSDKLFVSGFFREASEPWQAIGFLLDGGNASLTPEWFLRTDDPNGPLITDGGHVANGQNFTTGGGFVAGTQVRIVWPVLANYTFGDISSGPKEAYLFVHGLGLDGTLEWTTNLGLVRAYDLQSDMTATADGGVAIVCTSWDNGDIGVPADDGIFNVDDLPTSTANCLDSDFGYYVDGSGYAVDWLDLDNDVFDYWNTNAMVAKLDPSTGDMLWCTAWDADPGTNFECSPGDIRNQECLYKITEMPDGGLVVSGNTSHNFDDYYLTKLHSDCQSKIAYDITPDANGEHLITTNTTWTGDKNVLGTVIVTTGHTLSIASGNVRFADSEQLVTPTRLIVEAGAQLIIGEEATLTSIGSCPNSLWDGVMIQGNETSNQYPLATTQQGYMSIRGTIENARVAALVANEFITGHLSEAPATAWSGGIVQAKDAIFRNNVRDVSFSPFENHWFNPSTQQNEVAINRSSFLRTRFFTEGELADPERVPQDHVSLCMVRGIEFIGCKFVNDLSGPAYEFYVDQGAGIHSINSSFVVRSYCADNTVEYPDPCPEEDLTTTLFEGLHRGILATTFDLSRTFSVSQAVFRKVNCGIRMEGILDASITQCSFEVPAPRSGDEVSTMYAIYSDQCTGYRIESNDFKAATHDNHSKKVGLVIRDSGKDYNVFYNNTFDELRVGAIIMGLNGADNDGLETKCNDYGQVADNLYDVGLTGTNVTVKEDQGSQPVDQFDVTSPAGNRFSLGHSSTGVAESDWYVQYDCNLVTYQHHAATAGERLIPEYYDAIYLAIPTGGVVAQWPGKEEACPSKFREGRTREKNRQVSAEQHNAYEESKVEYEVTKDDGDTDGLLAYVLNPSNSSTQLRNALQSVAPNVSSEVFEAAFERSPSMSALHMTQALLSNSPLQNEVLHMVEDYGLPTYYAGLVAAGQNGSANILDLLKSAMAYHNGTMQEVLSDLGRKSWLDSTSFDVSMDSLKLWHETIPSPLSSLAIGGALTAEGAYAELFVLALEQEGLDDTEVYGVQKRFAAIQSTSAWNDRNEVDVQWLQALADQRDVIGSCQASAWLHALGADLPVEIVILPEEGPKAGKVTREPKEWPAETSIQAYPNPTAGALSVLYETPAECKRAEFVVLDLSERIVLRANTQIGPALATLPTTEFAAGTYLLQLCADGRPIEQTKFVVVR